MADRLAEALVHAMSGDIAKRGPAEKMLKEFEQHNFPLYLQGLCTQIQNPKLPLQARQMAGIQLKNTIVARDEQRRHELEKRWLMLQQQVRGNVKMQLLHTLNVDEPKLRHIAAQVVAKVSAIEIPRNMWRGLVPQLLHAISEKKTKDQLKEACFTTLGYVCEECPNQLQAHSNQILNAIASGMTKDQRNGKIKLEATRALANTLPMVKKNFNVPKERQLIMQMIFSASQSPDPMVRLACMQCLEEVARSYYKYIGGFIKNIYELTSNAIKKEGEDIAKQAIEFWTTVCEEEIDIQLEAKELEGKRQPQKQMFGFVKTAAPKLVELLLVCLTRQSEDPDDDTWNVAEAAAVCLQRIAQNIEDDVVPHVLPFITKKIRDQNWRFRDAATIAFACILDGPSKQKLSGLVKQAFGVILKHMEDGQQHVKDSAAWTVGKICDELPETISAEILPRLMHSLRRGLSETPKVANHVCWAIHNLAKEVKIVNNTSALSKYFRGMVEQLLVTASRADADHSLQHSAFEAMNQMIYNAAPDTYPFIALLVPELLKRLRTTLQISGNLSQHQLTRIGNAQAQLCAALSFSIVKNPQQNLQYMNHLMEYLIRVLRQPNSVAHEEALMCISAVARCTGQRFLNYMKVLQPFVMRHLRDTQSYKLCSIATGLVGDISRALEIKIAPFCNEIVEELMRNLQNGDLDRSVKPRILNCLGDIALAIGGHFERYLQWVMKLLEDASEIDFRDDRDDFENVEYLNILRESILESYVSILQGLHDDQKEGLFFRYMDKLVAFVVRISNDPDTDSMVTRAACSLIGDLARLLGHKNQKVKMFLLNNAQFKKIIADGFNSQDDETRKQADYARKTLQGLT